MDELIEYLEDLPPLDLIGYCPVTYHDVVRHLKPTMTTEEIAEAYEEYVRDYREFERRLQWDA